MELIQFKVPDGTKAELRKINPKLSDLLRQLIQGLLGRKSEGSALAKAGDVVGSVKGPANMARRADYLQQYAPKSHR